MAELKLDLTADGPLYRQIFEHMRQMIDSGALAAGVKLPTTRQLAEALQVNRATILAAYEKLASAGLVSGEVGRGSFVKSSARRIDWGELSPAGAARPPGTGGEEISFATARPAEPLFPLEEFRAACNEVLASAELPSLLQLGSPAGYGPLRQRLLEESRREGAARDGDAVLVTNGCQQALDLIARSLVRPGDRVAVEDPVYPGLKNLLLQAGARLVGIPVGPEGIEIPALAAAIEHDRPKLLVITPNFQNPTGATIPERSRESLLRLASSAGTVVVENDPYGELRYRGAPIPSLKRLDPAGDVILLRSFSKAGFPGLRVGWIVAPEAAVARLAEAKQLCDLHTDQFSQAVMLRFLESGRLDSHRQRVREAGAARLDAVLGAARRHLPRNARV
ncbi:MAG: PLP-dependent aminotransferase family protein, partial [Acidobacteria bacterium]|nr:PLP-dependent aminotransferase family protein [Acidobacteriota bacterium]